MPQRNLFLNPIAQQEIKEEDEWDEEALNDQVAKQIHEIHEEMEDNFPIVDFKGDQLRKRMFQRQQFFINNAINNMNTIGSSFT